MKVRVSGRNARFQQWEALLRNRTKRQRRGEFLVQGVRPITMAIEHGWQIRELLYDADGPAVRLGTRGPGHRPGREVRRLP